MNVQQAMADELAAARAEFHDLLASLSEEDFRRQSLNPGWTNGEILAHMTFGFIIINVLLPLARIWGRLPKGSSKWFAWTLNAVTRPFNVINEYGARGQGKVFTRARIGGVFDRACLSLLNKAASIREYEWERGMYYPTRWDPNFEEFMTLENLIRYPVVHLRFHRKQIAQ
ncbi:MAG TPA: DinB family protein [Anaerolineales bacterium]|nr:DinB family protein [Anaerolineales bacterium]